MYIIKLLTSTNFKRKKADGPRLHNKKKLNLTEILDKSDDIHVGISKLPNVKG